MGFKIMMTGLGPGQLVGRQVLGSPVLGDIQLSLCDKRGNLEVEVIRARGLQSKPGSKLLPGSFPWIIPFYLLDLEWHTFFLPSSLGKSVSGVREKVPGKGENLGREANPRSSFPTAAHLPSTLWRLCPPGPKNAQKSNKIGTFKSNLQVWTF